MQLAHNEGQSLDKKMALLTPIPCSHQVVLRGDLYGKVPTTSCLSSALRKGNEDSSRTSQGTDNKKYLVLGEFK